MTYIFYMYFLYEYGVTAILEDTQNKKNKTEKIGKT